MNDLYPALQGHRKRSRNGKQLRRGIPLWHAKPQPGSHPAPAYGLHSWQGFLPAWIASSRVAYRKAFFAEIFAADLQSGRWNTSEFLEET